MARYAKISTIGVPSFFADESHSFDQTLDGVEQFLTCQMEQVLPDRPDLIVLTEMCDIPANYDVARREAYMRHRGDRGMEFFARVARENNCNIAFSTYRFGAGDYTLNTMYVLDRSGNVAGRYDKNHVVVPSELSRNVRCGIDAPIIELDIGRVACVICFDLNFDVLREHYKALRPDIILFCSMYHGGIVQQFWAQSCRSYFVGAIAHSIPSSIHSPLGETLAYTTNYNNHVTATVNLDYALAHIDHHREKFAALKKKYGTDVMIHDPGNIGYYLITSQSETISAADMLRDLEIMPLDEYLGRALAAQSLPENRSAGE